MTWSGRYGASRVADSAPDASLREPRQELVVADELGELRQELVVAVADGGDPPRHDVDGGEGAVVLWYEGP